LRTQSIDGDTILVTISNVKSITCKELHERTGAVLDQVKHGQRFRVLRGGGTHAFLVPATRKARAQAKSLLPNPILAERKKRKHATRVTSIIG
jgi:antitoxin (DNA-binding transcriptional repressor) of toxin-antitoxin stability system